MLPDYLTGWTKLFTQSWEGDITVTLPHRLWNIGKAVTNPTPLDLVTATRGGEVATWEKLSAIECNCTIEATLDACMAMLQSRSRDRPFHKLRNRWGSPLWEIHAWLLHLVSTGQGFLVARVAAWHL